MGESDYGSANHRETRVGTAAEYRYDWDATKALLANWRLAMKKLEGLMYAVYGSNAEYSTQTQWNNVADPRRLWGVQQQVEKEGAVDRYWEYYRAAAKGAFFSGVGLPNVPVKSRSGNPDDQLAQASRDAVLTDSSLYRSAATAHDPMALQAHSWWPIPSDVTIDWYPGPSIITVDSAPVIKSSIGDFTMTQVQPGQWQATLPAQAQNVMVTWYMEVAVNGLGTIRDPLSGTYSWVHYTHYNPYASGLPEMDPAFRRGTDWYEFDDFENIQPELINLVRFTLEQLGYLTEHNPKTSRTDEECCHAMPVVFRWTGSNEPPIYEEESPPGPLHNRDPADGDPAARKTWRGNPVRWNMADSDLAPLGLLPNWEFGGDETWRPTEPVIYLDWNELEQEYQNRLRYEDRGLQDDDVITHTHLQEIIDAVDFLITNGIWRTTVIRRARRTADTAFGFACGYWDDYVTYRDESQCGLCWHDTWVRQPCHRCCLNCPANGWFQPQPTDFCDIYPIIPNTPQGWTDCGSTYSGFCTVKKEISHLCEETLIGDDRTDDQRKLTAVTCNLDDQSPPPPGTGIVGCFLGTTYNWSCNGSDKTTHQLSHDTYVTARNYQLCGPMDRQDGPDVNHGNGIAFVCNNGETQVSYLWSMGNKWNDLKACVTKLPGEPDVGFETVTQVEQLSYCDWEGQGPQCSGDPPSGNPPDDPSWLNLAIPGIGEYSLEPPYSPWCTIDDTPPYGCPVESGDPRQGMQCGASAQAVPCGDDKDGNGAVYVAVDLNLSGEGVPQLYDYTLTGLPVTPPDGPNCPP